MNPILETTMSPLWLQLAADIKSVIAEQFKSRHVLGFRDDGRIDVEAGKPDNPMPKPVSVAVGLPVQVNDRVLTIVVDGTETAFAITYRPA